MESLSRIGRECSVCVRHPKIPACCYPSACYAARWRNLKILGSALFGTAALVLLIMFFIPNSPVQSEFLAMLNYIRDEIPTAAGCIVLAVVYVLAMIFMLPGTPINLAAGLLYGVWIGSIVSVTGCTVGALIAFLLGRTFFRNWAEKQATKYKIFRGINRAVVDKGFLIIFLLRLSPIMPFAVCCYILGVTPVPFWVYSLSTFLGLLPATVAYTYMGTLLNDLSEVWSSGGKTKTTITIVAIIVTTLLLIIVITWVTKRALNKALQEQNDLESQLAPLKSQTDEAGSPAESDDAQLDNAIELQETPGSV